MNEYRIYASGSWARARGTIGVGGFGAGGYAYNISSSRFVPENTTLKSRRQKPFKQR